MITCLGIVTVSDGVEIHGGVNKTLVEEAIGVAPVHWVHTESVPGQCGVVLRGLVKGEKNGESLYYHHSWKYMIRL